MSFNPHNHTAAIYNSDNQPYEATYVEQVAHAVTPALVHADKTENHYEYINSFTLTQNTVLDALEKVSSMKWDVTHSKAKGLGESSWKKLKENESSELESCKDESCRRPSRRCARTH